MKRVTVLLISLMLVFGVMACQPPEQPPTLTPSETAPVQPPVTPTPEPVPTGPPPPLTPSLTPSPTPAVTPGFRVVGYISHWHFASLGNVELDRLTHLIWQGVEVTSDDDPTLHTSGDADWEQIARAVAAGHDAGIKVLVSLIGHWNESELNGIWQSSEERAQLINNLKELTVTYNLDGIDLDNESTCDPAMYSRFVRELYDALAPLGKIITMAGNPYSVCINSDAASYIDFINLMTYDMAKGIGYPYHSTLEESIQAINLWLKSGVPGSKLLMGIPFYGRDAYTSFFNYSWIVEKFKPGPNQNETPDPQAAGGKIWWNGPDLVKQKVEYVRDNNFGGVMVYEVGIDSPSDSSLLKSVFEALGESYEPQVQAYTSLRGLAENDTDT